MFFFSLSLYFLFVSSVRPFASLEDKFFSNATCADWEALGYNRQLRPFTCLMVSQFDDECGCSNAHSRSNDLVICDLCGTNERVNERYEIVKIIEIQFPHAVHLLHLFSSFYCEHETKYG
jgi:hypothetical protein